MWLGIALLKHATWHAPLTHEYWDTPKEHTGLQVYFAKLRETCIGAKINKSIQLWTDCPVGCCCFYRVPCFLSEWVSGKDKTLLWMGKVLGMDLPWRLEDWGGGVNHCFLLLFCHWQRDQGLFAIIVMFQMLWTTVQNWYRGSRADPETRSLRDNSWEIRLLPILLLDLRYEQKPWEVTATVFSTTLPQN